MSDYVSVHRDPDSSGAGAVIGVVLGVLLVLVLLWFLWLRPTYFVSTPSTPDTNVNIQQTPPNQSAPQNNGGTGGNTNITVPNQGTGTGSQDTSP